MHKKLIAGAAVVALAGALAVPALGATKTVKVGDIYFVKKGAKKPTVTAKKGDTVKWTWVGKFPHNVTVKSGPVKFKSKTQKSGTFSRKVTKAGTYTIICTIHGAAKQSMKLVVK
jgi:plastocyanin